jgi:histidinol-phosphate phosphatase family protein
LKQAVILAGGKGTRLQSRLSGRPKPLVDVCGIPLLERQIGLLKRHSFSNILVLVNHGAQQIKDLCSAKSNWGLRISCVDDGAPRGTAGAVLAAFNLLADEFLVIYGDTMVDVDLDRFWAFHSIATNVAGTIFLHPNDHPEDSDLVDMDDDGRITAFYPCPRTSGRYYRNLVNAALYCIRKSALEPWRNSNLPDFGKDLFPAMVGRNVPLRGYISPEYVKDCGTPSRLDKVCQDVAAGKTEASRLDRKQVAIFIDRDGTINEEVNHLRRADQLRLLPNVAAAITKLNSSPYRICVVTNQPVIARGECTLTELRNIHNKLDTLLSEEGGYVDKLYYCPHHPDKGFSGEVAELKIDCWCRKPKTGLIDQACEELNVDRARSWMVGDSTKDIETARRAGLKSILVETGNAGLDHLYWSRPDFVLPDLHAAADFILDVHPRLLRFATELGGKFGEGSVILVGGQSRSGKSTFSSVLRDALCKQGMSVVIFPVDSWLLSETDRSAGVLGRYDLAALQAMVLRLARKRNSNEVVEVPGYHKLRRERVGIVDSVTVEPRDIVILEGTVSLALDAGTYSDVHRLHIEIDEPERQRRVVREYLLRSFEPGAAADVYRTRRMDEYPVIENLCRHARRIRLADARSFVASNDHQ